MSQIIVRFVVRHPSDFESKVTTEHPLRTAHTILSTNPCSISKSLLAAILWLGLLRQNDRHTTPRPESDHC